MKSMFAVALLVSCLTGFLVATQEEEALAVMQACMTENGVTEQDITDLKSGNIKPEDVKDNVKCSAQCILVKFGFMNSKGVLLKDKVVEHFADSPVKDQVAKALAACGDVAGDNPCDTAYQMMSCLEKHVNEMMKM